MRQSVQTQLPWVLLESTDERDFLGRWYAWAKENKSGLTYAVLTRRAGFSSRSYVRDVMTGKRRLTMDALPRFVKAMELKGDFRRFFLLLVQSSPNRFDREGDAKVQDKITRLKSRVKADLEPGRFPLHAQSLYKEKNRLEIYAALGTREEGATLEEITQRTGYPKENCLKTLLQMIEDGAVCRGNLETHFFARESHLVLPKIGHQEIFKTSYLRLLEETKTQAKKEFESEDQLFMSSVFSIDPKLMPDFKNELRQLLIRFVDTAENPRGKKVVRLVTGFTKLN
jgi:uncharacterized protein (TIGR02147 family)